MKITLMAVGRIRAPFAEGQSHYLKMLRGPQPVEVVERAGDARRQRRGLGRALAGLASAEQVEDRGRGLGRALMQAAEGEAARHGRTLLTLDTASPAAEPGYTSQ